MVSRRELLKTAALLAGIPLAELAGLPIGRRSREAMAATLPRLHPGDVPDAVLLNARVHTMDAANRTVGIQGSEWAIPMAAALRWYRVGSAHAAFEDDVKGTLEPGKLADLIALSVDPLKASPTGVRDAKVLLTMVGGRIVHDGQPRRSELPPRREGASFAFAEGCHCVEPTG